MRRPFSALSGSAGTGSNPTSNASSTESSKHDSVGLYGDRFAFDSTHLPCSQTDPDGVWMWESAAEEWVYGYGLLVAVDCASDLPVGAVVVQRKQHPETATLECFERLVENTDVTMVLGDSAFDTLEFHDRCVDRQILPVCTYNPRNTADPLDIVFRIEALAEESGVQLNRTALQDAFDSRE
ncbi:transposase [Halococcus salifodinae]|nr:transposase [Halococcus salifodinae]